MLNSPSAQTIAEHIAVEVEGELAGIEGDRTALATLAALHQRLGRVLVPVVGDGGYRAIFARSMRKARTAYPYLEDVALAEADAFLEPLLARLGTKEEGTIRAATVALIAHLIELLVALVGPEITLTLLGREWPAATADALVPTERS
ncbi:MAG TPA: hypothetical protein VH044_15705 [Polyangiaceae bacterium]|nr:hypothetical protein [Polyangiaceae bacterium]